MISVRLSVSGMGQMSGTLAVQLVAAVSAHTSAYRWATPGHPEPQWLVLLGDAVWQALGAEIAAGDAPGFVQPEGRAIRACGMLWVRTDIAPDEWRLSATHVHGVIPGWTPPGA